MKKLIFALKNAVPNGDQITEKNFVIKTVKHDQTNPKTNLQSIQDHPRLAGGETERVEAAGIQSGIDRLSQPEPEMVYEFV